MPPGTPAHDGPQWGQSPLRKAPSELRLGPGSPRHGRITASAHRSPERGLAVCVGKTVVKMAHGTPQVGSPMVQYVRLAHHLSATGDSTRWQGPRGGLALFRVIWGHVWPIRARSWPPGPMGPFRATPQPPTGADGELGAHTAEPVQWSHVGVSTDHVGGRPDCGTRGNEPRPTRGLPVCCCLLLVRAVRGQVPAHPRVPTPSGTRLTWYPAS